MHRQISPVYYHDIEHMFEMAFCNVLAPTWFVFGVSLWFVLAIHPLLSSRVSCLLRKNRDEAKRGRNITDGHLCKGR